MFTPANIIANWAFSHFGFIVSPVKNENYLANPPIIANTVAVDRT